MYHNAFRHVPEQEGQEGERWSATDILLSGRPEADTGLPMQKKNEERGVGELIPTALIRLTTWDTPLWRRWRNLKGQGPLRRYQIPCQTMVFLEESEVASPIRETPGNHGM